MEAILSNIDTFLSSLLNSLGIYGALLGSLLILLESMVAILPLSVFITLNFYAFGNLFGFFISYILTVIGCNFAYYLSSRLFKNRIQYFLKKKNREKTKLITTFSNMKLKTLVMLMVFPFTPAFLINILSGISEMPHKKFLIASLIAKPFMVYFWGYIGVTFIQSFTHPMYFLRILVMIAVAYLVSTLINKKLDLD